MNRFLLAVVALLFPALAFAQPATTQPNANGMVISTCGSGLPVLGGGSGSPLTCGTRQGNTTKYPSVAGSFTNGNCLETDVNGNIIDAGSACGSGAGGGTSMADEATFTFGTTQFTPIGGIFSSSITNLTTGQAGVAQLTADRMLFTNLGKVNAVTVLTGTGAVGTGAQRIAVGTDTATIAGSAPGTAGTASANVLSVQGIASMTPILTNPGTAASWSLGSIASAVPSTGTYNAAQARTSEISAATNGNLTGLVTDAVGKLIISPFANKENYVKGTTAAMTGTTSTQLIAAVTSQKIYVTHISCVNSHATVGTFVTVQDGSGGTALTTLAAASVFGGDEQTGASPLFWTTAGNALFVADVTTGANVICNASGYSGV